MFGELSEVMPEIEEALRREIEETITRELEGELAKFVGKVEQQARDQYEEALQVLRVQGERLKDEKMRKLRDELQRVEEENQELEQGLRRQAQERFIEQNFQSRVMNHPIMVKIEKDIEVALFKQYQGEINKLKQKKARDVRIHLEAKEAKQRNSRDGAIKEEVYARSGLTQLRAEINAMKVGIGAKKSQYNIKIHGVEKEIKSLLECLKKEEGIDYDSAISELRQRIRQAELPPQTDPQMSLRRQIEDVQYLDEDVNLSSSQSSSLLEYRQNGQNKSLPSPPAPKHTIGVFESIEGDYGEKRLLNTNIREMLRERWEEDSLDRYLNKQNSKGEANSNVQSKAPKQASNFQSVYEQHLRRLNKGFNFKGKD